jgi:HD superfamily phosphodiesterase
VESAARDFAENVLASALPRRWAHVCGVGAAAERLGPLFGADAPVLIAAAWLHDVGYAPGLAVTGFHPVDGARALRSAGWPARVCALVAHHTCARIEAGLRGQAGALAEFADEATPLRDALWYCDLTTGPGGITLTLPDRLAEIEKR